jgi:hypothetical protein
MDGIGLGEAFALQVGEDPLQDSGIAKAVDAQ